MSYTPQTWADGPTGGTPVNASRLGHMEAGIAGAAQVSSNLSDLASVGTARANLGAQASYTSTAVQIANYTAAAWQVVPCNATAGSFTVTLPTGVSAGVQVAVKLLATSGANTVTVTAGGADVINVAGTTSAVLQLVSESFEFTSNGAGTWYLASGQKSLPSLDARYDAIGAALAERTRALAAEALLLPLVGGTVSGELDITTRLKASGFALPLTAPSTRKPAWRSASWQQLFQVGHGWTVGGGTGSASGNANDTSMFVKGTQCVSVTTAANGLQSQIRNTAMSAIDLTGKMLRLTFKLDDVTHLNHLSFYVGTGSFSNFFQWVFHTHSTIAGQQNWVQSGEWVTVTLSWSSVTTASGTYSLSTTKVPSTTTGFTDMQLAGYDDAAGAVTYHLQAIEVIPDTTPTFPTGVISITFDDSYQSVYDLARPGMDTLGYRASSYTIVDYIGTASRLTLPELQTLNQFSGWEIAGHAYTNAAHATRYPNLTAQQVDDELRNLRAWLVTNGFGGDTFAYPGGNFSTTTDGVPVDSLVSRYFSAARCIISDTYESFTAPMPFRLRALTGVNDGTGLGGTTVAALTGTGGALDQCVVGTWLILCFHNIVTTTPTDSTMCTQAGFNTVMSAINSRGIPVLPVGDVLRLYS